MFLCILAALVFYGLVDTEAQCRASGRFANELAEDCRGYTTCIAMAGGASYQYDLVCPPGFLYNHLDSQCTNASAPAYRCQPAERCASRLPGSYAAPEAADCGAFLACVQGMSGLSARLVACAPHSLFDPEQQFCVNNDQYACPSASASASPPTPTLPPAPATAPGDPEVTTAKPNSSSSTTAASFCSHIILLTIVYGANNL